MSPDQEPSALLTSSLGDMRLEGIAHTSVMGQSCHSAKISHVHCYLKGVEVFTLIFETDGAPECLIREPC